MPHVIVDARGLTFRASGARSRLLALLGAYVQLPDAYDLTVVASAGRGALQLLRGHGLAGREVAPPGTLALIQSAVYRGSSFGNADIVHCETYPTPLFSSKPVVLTIHDLRSSEQPGLASSRAKGIYERRALPHASRRLDRIVAVSHYTAQEVKRQLSVPEDRIVVIPNAPSPITALDPTAVSLIPDRFLLALGHIEPRKNLATLIPLMEELTSDPGWPIRSLVVAGRDLGGVAELEALYGGMRGTFELIIRTEVSEEEKSWLLHHADGVLSPSLLEGFGMVPVEAMSVGTPVVASDIPATREVLSGGCPLVDPADTPGFARAVRRVVLDEDFRQQAITQGRRLAKQYTWERSAAILHTMYQDLLRPGAQRA